MCSQGYLNMVYMSVIYRVAAARGIEEYPIPATRRKCIKKL